ncbi:phosphatase PAP2 family protein [Salsuginibacillus kocurii]|uniref:phosphatase PAP2 family protein n=1 Tax=Salsuginibacillus kocurii TaxID=427078 RepID=UPI00036F7816|nr:phosphatase PAP2 family protein [Salsuginibacillus kocurii]
MDTFVFKEINGLAGRFPFLDNFMVFMTEYSLTFFLIALFFMLVTGIKKRLWLHTGLIGIITVAASMAAGFLIKTLFFRPRPFMTDLEMELLLTHNGASSFPSNHTLAAFALAFAVWFMHKNMGRLFLAAAFLTGISRIYVGHHYPFDVLASVIIAGLISYAVYHSFLRKGWIAKEGTLVKTTFHHEEKLSS